MNENDEEEDTNRTNIVKTKSRASKILKRLSFSKNISAESTVIHSNSAPNLNVLVSEQNDEFVANEMENGRSVTRRPSSSGRLFKAISFNLSSKTIGDDKTVTSGDSSSANNVSVADDQKLERRSSKMFRKLSFTSSS